MPKQPRLTVVPVTLPVANRYVARWHRHHAPLPGGFGWFCVAALDAGRICGVAIAGRPTNRNNDTGQTVEVLRVASDGTSNVCSALLGACARAAKAIGAERIITYTLTDEPGSSLRGAGWVLEDGDTGRSWWNHKGTRTPAVDRAHMGTHKARWGLRFRAHVEVIEDRPEKATEQLGLDL